VLRTKRLFGADKVQNVTRGEIRHTRTYDADGHVTVLVSTTEQDLRYCYSLGYQDFFPGLGHLAMHNLNQITLI
jgi:hypothetical protein